MPYPLGAKKRSLTRLNINLVLGLIGLAVGGLLAFHGLRAGKAYEALVLLGFLIFLLFLYGVNRLGVNLLYFRRPTATPQEIDDARRKLRGESSPPDTPSDS